MGGSKALTAGPISAACQNETAGPPLFFPFDHISVGKFMRAADAAFPPRKIADLQGVTSRIQGALP
ncbi:MAG TPA: hypothetical protein DDZ68_00130 [Parvularcula sp.]|nr:hypothetical protein [Parvularcula sp.]HBS33290.1 hypothetical protein [Parvularcula sp.]HBS34194.1 hypothetical protein [Parvularcula sp.]